MNFSKPQSLADEVLAECEAANQILADTLVDPNDPFSESMLERMERNRACDGIEVRVDEHAMCGGCDCIFRRGSTTDVRGICPICHSYRFCFDAPTILRQVTHLRTRYQQVVLPNSMLPNGRHP